ncbi:MAG TPA: N-acetyltransferase [Dehalococcoidia bacterium]|nr:N-acetyltransferase [Dehalococcoidia bacterium]
MELRGMVVTLRAATDDDCQVVFDWANDPLARSMSFNSILIDWEEHQRWFAESLLSETRQLFIGMEGAERVGMVRLDQTKEDFVVSLNVAPSVRGRGLGPQLLVAIETASKGMGANKLVAYIRPDNSPSVRCFEAVGYTLAGQEMQGDVEALRYVRAVSS